MGILAESAFLVRSTHYRTKGKIPVQPRDIRQRKQVQMIKYIIRENTIRIDHEYRVGDKVLANNKSGYK